MIDHELVSQQAQMMEDEMMASLIEFERDLGFQKIVHLIKVMFKILLYQGLAEWTRALEEGQIQKELEEPPLLKSKMIQGLEWSKLELQGLINEKCLEEEIDLQQVLEFKGCKPLMNSRDQAQAQMLQNLNEKSKLKISILTKMISLIEMSEIFLIQKTSHKNPESMMMMTDCLSTYLLLQELQAVLLIKSLQAKRINTKMTLKSLLKDLKLTIQGLLSEKISRVLLPNMEQLWTKSTRKSQFRWMKLLDLRCNLRKQSKELKKQLSEWKDNLKSQELIWWKIFSTIKKWTKSPSKLTHKRRKSFLMRWILQLKLK